MRHPEFRGVYENINNKFNLYGKNKWVARIIIKGKQKNLIYTNDAEEAAREYDKWAKYYFKDKAILNFPEEVDNGKC